MMPQELRDLIGALLAGDIDENGFIEELAGAPLRVETEGDLTLDHHRWLRLGFGEAVLAEGKSTDQVLRAMEGLASEGRPVLATRLGSADFEAIEQAFPAARVNRVARTAALNSPVIATDGPPRVLLVTAGASDLAVAQEALETLLVLGVRADLIQDVGVSGPHRVLAHVPRLREAEVIIVVAGMEAALPSLVGGLTGAPVIGVPTSVGYGVGAGGFVALGGMLSSCAPGVTVVNIDNGFGAASAAARVLLTADSKR